MQLPPLLLVVAAVDIPSVVVAECNQIPPHQHSQPLSPRKSRTLHWREAAADIVSAGDPSSQFGDYGQG